jgi:hypothetical protein
MKFSFSTSVVQLKISLLDGFLDCSEQLIGPMCVAAVAVRILCPIVAYLKTYRITIYLILRVSNFVVCIKGIV